MEYISLLIGIAVIFLPGLIAMKLDLRLASKRNDKLHSQIINTFLFGVAIYLIVNLIYKIIGFNYSHPTLPGFLSENGILSWFKSETTVYDYWDELFCSIPLAVLIGFIWYRIEKLLLKLNNLTIKINESSNNEVKHTEVESSISENKGVSIRLTDTENSRRYIGNVIEEDNENDKTKFKLRNVKVFDLNDKQVSEATEITVFCTKDKFTLEYLDSGKS